MTRQLRAGRGKNGLILCNGGVLTYQHVICLSTSPRTSPYPTKNPLPDHIEDVPAPKIADNPAGDAVIESYTVDWNRDGTPATAHVVGRLRGSGERFVANGGGEATLAVLAAGKREPIGLSGVVKPDPKREGCNLFELVEGARL